MKINNFIPRFILPLVLCPVLYLSVLTAAPAQGADIRALSFSGEPWSFSADGSKGVIPRFYDALAAKTGIEITVKIVPYKRMLFMLESGDADIAIFFKSSKSLKVAHPFVSLTRLDTIAFPRHGLQLHSYSDLQNLTIGVKRGVAIQPRFDRDSSLQKVLFNNYDQAALMLEKKRVDVITGSEGSLLYNFSKAGYRPAPGDKALSLFKREVWLQTSKAHAVAPDILARLKEGARYLAESNLYRQTLDTVISEAMAQFENTASGDTQTN